MDLDLLITALQAIKEGANSPKETEEETPKEPKDEPKETLKEPKEEPEETSKEPKETPKEPKDEPKETPKEPKEPKEPKGGKDVNLVVRELVISQAGVPKALVKLLPQGLPELQEFLKSDEYKSLKTALEAAGTIQEPKDDAPKTSKPPKDTPRDTPKAKTFKDISLDDLKAFGAAFSE